FEPRRNDRFAAARDQLAAALEQFRGRAATMAEEISICLPGLTDHSVRHLDALWEMADLVAGAVPLSPLDTFACGAAVLLQDLGNAVVAFPNRIDDLRGPRWDDLVTDVYGRRFGRRPSPEEMASPPDDVRMEVVLGRLRQEHAAQAEILA